jgi:hypothetical protein
MCPDTNIYIDMCPHTTTIYMCTIYMCVCKCVCVYGRERVYGLVRCVSYICAYYLYTHKHTHTHIHTHTYTHTHTQVVEHDLSELMSVMQKLQESRQQVLSLLALLVQEYQY